VSAAAGPAQTGVGRAIVHQARALAAGDEDLGLELRPLCRLSRARRRRYLPADLPATAYHERWSRLLARQLDVLHGPDSRLPRFSGPALVATVHDLSCRRPGFSSDRFVRTREAHWRRVAARADLVVTYTEAVRGEVQERLGIPLARSVAVPLAPTEFPPPPARVDPDAALRELTGDAPFVLFLGERSRRKNAAGAVEAFAAAGAQLRGLRLLLVGSDGHGAQGLEARIEALGLGHRVRIVSHAPDWQVGVLLQRARALLFPSRYEGFGLPVLEAFAAGTPVIASTDPSVLEVSGGAALHADAEDAQGLGAHLGRVVEDADLRDALVTRGRRRARDFSWPATARRLAAVYQAAARRGQAPPPLTPSGTTAAARGASPC
jgi:glycosyltransferase involved in cell wall biosynthesis